MKNHKKSVAVLLAGMLAATGSCSAFIACGGNGDGHIHTFVSEWSSDESEHWLEASCDHDERGSVAPHAYPDGGNICIVCGYTKADTAQYFEAEDGLFGSPDMGIDVTSEARGGKAVSRFRDALKASVTFYINSSVAEQNVPMTLRLASACEYAGEEDHDMSRYDLLTVNGKKVDLTGTVKQRMSGWFEWNNVFASIDLDRGSNVIVVHYDYNRNIQDENPGWGLCLNFDYIALEPKTAVLTTPAAEDDVALGVTVDKNLAKTYYETGDALSKNGLTVKAIKLNGAERTLNESDYTLECDMTTAGNKQVVVRYGDITQTYGITVYEKTTATPTSLVLDTSAVKKEYNIGSQLDLTGLTAKAVYSGGEERGVDICDLTYDPLDTSGEVSEATVTLHYRTVTATYTVRVARISKFEAENGLLGADMGIDTTNEASGGRSVSRFRDALKSSVTFYIDSSVAEQDVPMTLRLASACEYAGEEDHDMSRYDLLTVNGEKVGLTGTLKKRRHGNDWFYWHDIVANVDLDRGRNVIVVHYDYNETIKDENPGWGLCLNFDYISFETKNADLTESPRGEVETGIEVSLDRTLAKTYYTVGETLSKNGLTVKAKKLDGSASALAADAYTLECDMATAGNKEVTVKYKDFTHKYEITVYEATTAAPVELKLDTANVKKEYNAHSELDLTGLVATVKYDNDEERGVNICDLSADPVDMSEEAASLTVTLRYGGLSASYTVSVVKYTRTVKFEAEDDGFFSECAQENGANVNGFWASKNSKLTFYAESSAAETEAKIVLRLACACEEDHGDHDMSGINLLKVNGSYVGLVGVVPNRMTTAGNPWTNYVDIVATNVPLKLGVNEIVLDFGDPAIYNRLNIDYITVSTVSAEVTSRLYQAEDAEYSCGGEATDGASGYKNKDSFNLLHIDNVSDSITWKINSDVEREVTLVLRLASRKNASDNVNSIDVGNLKQYELLSVNGQNTEIDGELRPGVWLNFSEFEITVTLAAGENTITLHGCTDSGDANASYVKLQVDCMAVKF